MAAFMHRGEHEHHRDPLTKQGHRRDRTVLRHGQPQADPDQSQMAGKLD